MPAWRRGAWMGAFGPFVTVLRILKPPQQLGWPEPFPGQHFPHHPVDLRPRDPGHLFPPKPVAGSAEKLRAQQAQGHVVMPASPGAGLVLVQAYVAFLRLKLRFYTPTGASHVCQGLQRGGSGALDRCSGVRCRPGSGGTTAQWISPGLRKSHPLGAEKVAAWPAGWKVGRRNLTPGLLRQLVAALLHGWRYLIAAWVCGDARIPDTPPGPGRLRRPHRKAGRNVQHVPHPQGGQALPEGRRHPEGVVRRTHPAFRWPRSCARPTISKANSVLDR